MQILRNANFVVFLKLANRSLYMYLNCMVIGISFITMKSCVVDLSSKEISIRHTTLSIRQVNCIGYIRQRRYSPCIIRHTTLSIRQVNCTYDIVQSLYLETHYCGPCVGVVSYKPCFSIIVCFSLESTYQENKRMQVVRRMYGVRNKSIGLLLVRTVEEPSSSWKRKTNGQRNHIQ